jgi:hypothetical protein
MNRLKKLVILVALVGISPISSADSSAGFEGMKTMLGEWAGTLNRSTGEVVETRSTFRLVSGGNTIIETLVEDGVEMITTYSDNDGEMVVRHYCSLGTEPEFKVAKATATELSFTLDETIGYHEGHHDFVQAISYAMDPKNPNEVIVSSVASVGGEAQSGRAVIRRVSE